MHNDSYTMTSLLFGASTCVLGFVRTASGGTRRARRSFRAPNERGVVAVNSMQLGRERRLRLGAQLLHLRLEAAPKVGEHDRDDLRWTPGRFERSKLLGHLRRSSFRRPRAAGVEAARGSMRWDGHACCCIEAATFDKML